MKKESLTQKILFWIHFLLYFLIPTGVLIYHYMTTYNEVINDLVTGSFGFALVLYIIAGPLLIYDRFPTKISKIIPLFIPYIFYALFIFINPIGVTEIIEKLFIESVAVMSSLAIGILFLILFHKDANYPSFIKYVRKHPIVLISLAIILFPLISVGYLLWESWTLLAGPEMISMTQGFFAFLLLNTTFFFVTSLKNI
jgi:hypothetical protein